MIERKEQREHGECRGVRELQSLLIVLAEDNPDHAELVMDMLEELDLDHTLEHVKNGQDLMNYLLAALQKNRGLPDLILLDLKMPRMDGKAVLRKLQEHSRLQSIPVVVVSTSTNEHEINECYKLGASGYISKPVSTANLDSKIQCLCGQR